MYVHGIPGARRSDCGREHLSDVARQLSVFVGSKREFFENLSCS